MQVGEFDAQVRRLFLLLFCNTFFAFSRYEKTHPNFVSQALEIAGEFLDCKLAAYVFAGAWGLVFVSPGRKTRLGHW